MQLTAETLATVRCLHRPRSKPDIGEKQLSERSKTKEDAGQEGSSRAESAVRFGEVRPSLAHDWNCHNENIEAGVIIGLNRFSCDGPHYVGTCLCTFGLF